MLLYIIYFAMQLNHALTVINQIKFDFNHQTRFSAKVITFVYQYKYLSIVTSVKK